jgi:hypothetical protein
MARVRGRRARPGPPPQRLTGTWLPPHRARPIAPRAPRATTPHRGRPRPRTHVMIQFCVSLYVLAPLEIHTLLDHAPSASSKACAHTHDRCFPAKQAIRVALIGLLRPNVEVSSAFCRSCSILASEHTAAAATNAHNAPISIVFQPWRALGRRQPQCRLGEPAPAASSALPRRSGCSWAASTSDSTPALSRRSRTGTAGTRSCSSPTVMPYMATPSNRPRARPGGRVDVAAPRSGHDKPHRPRRSS